MKLLCTYKDINLQQWQTLIEQSATATWFQTPEAYQFYSSIPDEMMPFVVGVSECKVESVKCKGTDSECKVEGVECKGTENSGAEPLVSTPYTLHHTPSLKGVVVGYITRAHNPLKQFFTRRAIIIGGPLLAEDISDEALVELLKAVKECKVESVKCKGTENGKADALSSRLIALSPHRLTPIYIETRNLHDYSRWKSVFEANGFAYQPHLNIQVTCNAAHSMSEQRIRQVRKAMKNGVEICQAQSEEDVKAWYQILKQLYRTKVRTPLWDEEFFLQFYRKELGKYLLVKYDGKVISGMMCPILDGKAIYEWYVCGLDEEYREMYPSVIATYAAIEYAKEHGLQLFDFMGAGKPDVPYGVRDFKMEFGGELVEYGRYVFVQKPLLYKIGQWGVKWLKHKR